jgi:cell division protein FtsB
VAGFGRLAFLVLFILGLYIFGRSAYTIWRLSVLKKAEEKSVRIIEAERDSLKNEINRLTSDSLYIEEIARSEYGMIKPGEKTYRITLPDSTVIKKNTAKNKK